MADILYSTDGRGRWFKRKFAPQCPAKVFFGSVVRQFEGTREFTGVTGPTAASAGATTRGIPSTTVLPAAPRPTTRTMSRPQRWPLNISSAHYKDSEVKNKATPRTPGKGRDEGGRINHSARKRGRGKVAQTEEAAPPSTRDKPAEEATQLIILLFRVLQYCRGPVPIPRVPVPIPWRRKTHVPLSPTPLTPLLDSARNGALSTDISFWGYRKWPQPNRNQSSQGRSRP